MSGLVSRRVERVRFGTDRRTCEIKTHWEGWRELMGGGGGDDAGARRALQGVAVNIRPGISCSRTRHVPDEAFVAFGGSIARFTRARIRAIELFLFSTRNLGI